MGINIISTADPRSPLQGSFKENVVQVGSYGFFEWYGIAKLEAGVRYSSLDLKCSSSHRGRANKQALVAPANSAITFVGLYLPTDIKVVTDTTGGVLKLATSLTASSATQYVVTAGASGGTIAKHASEANAVVTRTLPASAVTVGSSDVTFKIYGVDATTNSAGSAVADQFYSDVDTEIYGVIAGLVPLGFPSADQFEPLPASTYQS